MTEMEARGLAAELDSHKWWRVKEVKPANASSLSARLGLNEWWVKLEHRTVRNLNYLIPECDSTEDAVELAEVLMFYGEYDHVHETTGMRWYYHGQEHAMNYWHGDLFKGDDSDALT